MSKLSKLQIVAVAFFQQYQTETECIVANDGTPFFKKDESYAAHHCAKIESQSYTIKKHEVEEYLKLKQEELADLLDKAGQESNASKETKPVVPTPKKEATNEDNTVKNGEGKNIADQTKTSTAADETKKVTAATPEAKKSAASSKKTSK